MIGQVGEQAFQSGQTGRDVGSGEGGTAGEDPTSVAMSGHDLARRGDAPIAGVAAVVGKKADLGSEVGIGFQGLCDVGEEAGQGKARIALSRHESRWYPRMLPPNDSGRNRGATASRGVDQ